ncbi:hypothetical protein LOZ20_002860 [Ophidiomyces ophidiicola]|nr:hypothetical protein LOZ50_006256 [Ophidiomyces ophidiicola]KAI2196896.1 hypothetical protein LOZ20_002860 [Ophidiomyces ophidiicola]KAI2203274.1 hypothetical protein LOZ18_001629 [Ophidiomyces ophidiicola]KAI2211565.1 hypothetical protein LOZ17_005854 [Ophidiomyces ophidiicola]KAI2218050.1 hypothetical protein LOZ15_003387 [Ophidiomyces ophidiicola]
MLNAIYPSEQCIKAPLDRPVEQAPQRPAAVKRNCIAPEIDLPLFEDLPEEYDPSTWWLDGHAPAHPHLDNDAAIKFWVRAIKQPLLACILEGCGILLERANEHALLSSLASHELLWQAAVSVQKYGVVYLATRSECRDEFRAAVERERALFGQMDEFLRADGQATRAINYGIHRLINTGGFTVEHHQRLIPPRAIAALGPQHVAVRRQDFAGASTALLDEARAVWDLHDFAHLTAASLSAELYGSKYFTQLAALPARLTALRAADAAVHGGGGGGAARGGGARVRVADGDAGGGGGGVPGGRAGAAAPQHGHGAAAGDGGERGAAGGAAAEQGVRADGERGGAAGDDARRAGGRRAG